jgi:uncharacterized membrane protein
LALDVQVETVVARPRAEVAAYLFDWRNDTEWIGGISEARRVGDGAFGVGAHVARVARFLGMRIEYVNEVVELEPESRLAMRSVKGPFPMRVTYELDDAGAAGTRVRLRNEGGPSRAYGLVWPLLSRAVRRATQRDLDRLKRIIESQS